MEIEARAFDKQLTKWAIDDGLNQSQNGSDQSMDGETDNSLKALEQLRALLRSGQFAAGSRLPSERELVERYGVSRRSLRRAFEVLTAEGLVWRRQGSGSYAGMPPAEMEAETDTLVARTDPMEVMEARLRLEPQLAQLAAMRAKPDEIRGMYELVGRISDSTDADGRELWDGALHRKIAQASGNGLLLALFDVMNRVRQDAAWQRIREEARVRARTKPITYDQHLAIIDAIAARNPAMAAEAMRRHLLTLQESLIRATSHDSLVEVSET